MAALNNDEPPIPSSTVHQPDPTTTKNDKQNHRSLHFSDTFVISCGTVTIDLFTNQVLLIYSASLSMHLLPKGRKDINESLPSAALRETLEESGYAVQLLPNPLKTCAPDYVSGSRHTEPFAVQQRWDEKHGMHKVIFWFLATADSKGERKMDGGREEWEDFEARWVGLEDAEGVVAHKDDWVLVRRAVEAVRLIREMDGNGKGKVKYG
ncbi:hypothetical protein AJ80_03015 [Polytolypa hystricis UAMH7299]|uniref:Nudix hydrolase domain-containing protein n=1 Tax=Polytolypa hystricis (strain UAMH7299) TaxID=1447883 RepID=A0A2B7YMY7_POLH7|nr:hypothetical protein AJ80_03015 [Polytolypa hystricis UAMH7299]